MNPNSQHQRWSLWEYRVYPDAMHRPPFGMVKENAARFGRLMFGNASQMRIRCATDAYCRLFWEIAVLSEGHPVHDPQWTEWMNAQWTQFFRKRFGASCEVQCHARLEAGDREDGRPPDQLIVLPGLKL